MAWGSSKPKAPSPPRSALSKLLPLFFVLALVLGAAFIGYHLYLSFLKIQEATSNKMEARNLSISKDGMKVGVKEMKNENYVDKTQNMLVKAWNLSEWPAYKSRFWNKQTEGAEGKGGGKSPRPDAGGRSPSLASGSASGSDGRKASARHGSTTT